MLNQSKSLFTDLTRHDEKMDHEEEERWKAIKKLDEQLDSYHESQVAGKYLSKMVTKTFEYDGKCDILKQDEPDYNKNEQIYLNDGLEEESDTEYKTRELLNWQSENLFVNDSIIYFIALLAALLVIILLNEKFNKKNK